MSSSSAFFYGSLLAKSEQACLTEWRSQLMKHVHGNVLEIGVGTEANILFYPKNGIELTLSESDKHRPDAIKFYEKLGFHFSRERMKLHLKSSE